VGLGVSVAGFCVSVGGGVGFAVVVGVSAFGVVSVVVAVVVVVVAGFVVVLAVVVVRLGFSPPGWLGFKFTETAVVVVVVVISSADVPVGSLSLQAVKKITARVASITKIPPRVMIRFWNGVIFCVTTSFVSSVF
jgi:hypothetical protein